MGEVKTQARKGDIHEWVIHGPQTSRCFTWSAALPRNTTLEAPLLMAAVWLSCHHLCHLPLEFNLILNTRSPPRGTFGLLSSPRVPAVIQSCALYPPSTRGYNTCHPSGVGLPGGQSVCGWISWITVNPTAEKPNRQPAVHRVYSLRRSSFLEPFK